MAAGASASSAARFHPPRNPAVTVRLACLGFVFDKHAQPVIRACAPKDFEISFAEQPGDLTEAMLAGSDMLLTVAPVTDDMMARAKRLRFIQKWGTGYDKIDVAAAERHGIAVAITAGANADTIAEHALTLMLTVLRRIVVADRALREGRWIPADIRPVGQRLFGRTVGLVGFGNVGRAAARQLRGFGTTVLENMVGRALGAEVTRTLHDDGIEWRFAIPNEALDPARDPHGETELEKPGSAGAPAPATVPSAEK